MPRTTRALLIPSVTTSIPRYVMQNTYLPAGVVEELKKINRNFLWESQEHQRTMHHLAWDRVCNSKAAGGLGIQKLKETNLVALARLCWHFLNEPNNI